MTGIVLEKQTLERKRDVTRQYYQLDLLLELHAQSRLRIQKLTSPSLQIAAEGRLPSTATDAAAENSNWAMESYLVTEADNESAASNSVDQDASAVQRRPSTSEAVPSKPSLPLLRWQQPVSADRANPNRR